MLLQDLINIHRINELSTVAEKGLRIRAHTEVSRAYSEENNIASNFPLQIEVFFNNLAANKHLTCLQPVSSLHLVFLALPRLYCYTTCFQISRTAFFSAALS